MIELIEPFVLVSLAEGLFQLLNPANLFTILIDGLAKASLYIMIASGLTIIFGLIKVVNFAHGAFTMLGAYLGGAFMVFAAGIASGDLLTFLFFFIGIAVVLALMTALGSLLEFGLIRPLYDRGAETDILLTFGLTFVLTEMMYVVLEFTDLEPIVPWQEAGATLPGFLEADYQLVGIGFQGIDLFEIFFGVILVAGVWAFLNRTRYGLHVRAATQDEEMTEALGIDVPRTFTVVFGVGVGIAGIAGMMLMWDSTGILGQGGGASVLLSTTVLLPAFVVVIVGGLGTFKGTVYAGIGIGMIDALATWLFVNNIVPFAALPEMMLFLILVVVLAVRPRGLFGVQEAG